jgi:IK cytokine
LPGYHIQVIAEPAAAANKPADEDEDIFGDAGKDYQPELPKVRDGKEPVARGSYFDQKDDMKDLPALPKQGVGASGFEQ